MEFKGGRELDNLTSLREFNSFAKDFNYTIRDMKFFFFLLLFVLPCAVWSQTVSGQQSDLERAGLKGRMSELKLYTEETDRRGFTYRHNPEITTFDSAGMISNTLIMTLDTAKVVQELHYTYKGGLLVNKKDEMKMSILSGVTEERYTWNEEKRLAEKATYEGELGKAPEKLTQIEKFVYDKRGNCIEDSTAIFFPVRSGKSIRTVYSDLGRRLRSEIFENGKRQGYTEYRYDKDGRVKTETERDDSGRAKLAYIYAYDQSGHTTMVQGIQYNYPLTTIIRQSLTLNIYRDDLLTESTTETNSQKDFKTEYRYSNVDGHGNWLMKETIRNEKLSLVERREVEYY